MKHKVKSENRVEIFGENYWQYERDMVYYISCQRGGDAEREVEKSPKNFHETPWQAAEDMI